MADNTVNFKSGTTIEGKTINDNDFVAINRNMTGETDTTEQKFGSTYKGSKIIGTTEADKLCITETFKVIGTTVGNLGANTEITKGTDIMTLLKRILQKTIDVKVNAPTATLTASGDTQVEYGTVTGDTTFTVTLNQGSFTGAESGYSTTQAMDCKLSEVKVDGNTATIAENGLTASYTVTGSAITATKSVSATASATANTVVPKKNDGSNSTKSYTGGSITVSGTKTWTPYFNCYIGYANKTTVKSITSADIRALNAVTGLKVGIAGESKTLLSEEKESNGQSIIIALPKECELSEIQNSLGASIMGLFSLSGTVVVNCAGGTTHEYTVYLYSITNGTKITYKNVKIVKA